MVEAKKTDKTKETGKTKELVKAQKASTTKEAGNIKGNWRYEHSVPSFILHLLYEILLGSEWVKRIFAIRFAT